MKVAVLLNILFISQLLYAGGKFGPEWTFTNKELIREGRDLVQEGDKDKYDYIEALSELISKKFPNLENDGYREFKLNKDFWFLLTTDPWVIEVVAAPMTAVDFEKHMPKVQEVLFDTAKEAGLTPHKRLVGGHIHLDLKSHFGDDQLLIKNFIVDMFNHSELFMGVLELDYMNAPPVTTLGAKALKELKLVLQEFDDMKGKKFFELFDAIKERVYEEGQSIMEHSKYQAVNLDHEETIEIRGFRPQTSAEHYLDMIKLLDARIAYLKTIKEPIEFTGKNQASKISHKVVKSLSTYKTALSAKRRAKVYFKYVTEAGLDWNTYKKYPVDKDVLTEAKLLHAPAKKVKPKAKKKVRACKALMAS